MSEINKWKRLAAEKYRIEKKMRASISTLIGKRVWFKFGNMARIAQAEVLYAELSGERICVQNIATGGKRMISPYHIALINATLGGEVGDE